MWYDGYPFGAPLEPSYKPTPQKRSQSTLSAPTGLDWVRRPCYLCNQEGCLSCHGKGLGWSPDRLLPEVGKPDPIPMNRYRRDPDGQWFLGPDPKHLPAEVDAGPFDPISNAFGTSPQKRIEINIPPKPHPSGPDEYFGGANGFYGGP